MLTPPEFEKLFRGVYSPKDTRSSVGLQIDVCWQKYVLSFLAKPKTICEIGVRYGYSAWSFLLGTPEATYTGYDNYAGLYGGGLLSEGLCEHAANLIESVTHKPANIVIANTQMMQSIIPSDFYHVDGDHSPEGALHDIELCYAAASNDAVILVDDYTYLSEVASAVANFRCKSYKMKTRFFNTVRGDIAIVKGASLPEWMNNPIFDSWK